MSELLGVRVRLLRPASAVPRYATPDAAACDLTAATDEPITVPRGTHVSIPTGIAIEMTEPDIVAVVCARSGLAFRHSLSLVNGIGVIDADFRGEIAVGLRNDGDADYTVMPGERIAQLLFLPCRRASFTAVDELSDTERGTGGFGSTGKL